MEVDSSALGPAGALLHILLETAQQHGAGGLHLTVDPTGPPKPNSPRPIPAFTHARVSRVEATPGHLLWRVDVLATRGGEDGQPKWQYAAPLINLQHVLDFLRCAYAGARSPVFKPCPKCTDRPGWFPSSSGVVEYLNTTFPITGVCTGCGIGRSPPDVAGDSGQLLPGLLIASPTGKPLQAADGKLMTAGDFFSFVISDVIPTNKSSAWWAAMALSLGLGCPLDFTTVLSDASALAEQPAPSTLHTAKYLTSGSSEATRTPVPTLSSPPSENLDALAQAAEHARTTQAKNKRSSNTGQAASRKRSRKAPAAATSAEAGEVAHDPSALARKASGLMYIATPGGQIVPLMVASNNYQRPNQVVFRRIPLHVLVAHRIAVAVQSKGKEGEEAETGVNQELFFKQVRNNKNIIKPKAKVPIVGQSPLTKTTLNVSPNSAFSATSGTPSAPSMPHLQSSQLFRLPSLTDTLPIFSEMHRQMSIGTRELFETVLQDGTNTENGAGVTPGTHREPSMGTRAFDAAMQNVMANASGNFGVPRPSPLSRVPTVLLDTGGAEAGQPATPAIPPFTMMLTPMGMGQAFPTLPSLPSLSSMPHGSIPHPSATVTAATSATAPASRPSRARRVPDPEVTQAAAFLSNTTVEAARAIANKHHKPGPKPKKKREEEEEDEEWDDAILDLGCIEFNRWVKSSGLTDKEIGELKKARRRKKNRLYAKRSREKKLQEMMATQAKFAELEAKIKQAQQQSPMATD